MNAMTVVKRGLREARDNPAVIAGIRLAKRGQQVYCPCCESEFRSFRAYRGEDRICWVCGSMERHRSVWLYMDQHPEMEQPGMAILHVAPERILRNRFRRIDGVRWVGGDLTAEFGPERLDVTDLDFADREFDAVVCNHVLEHVPDDVKAMEEIRRVLKPNGWALLQVPDLEWNREYATDEQRDIDDPEEQLRRFGQRDHVRRYGWDYVDRLVGAGLQVEVVRPDEVFDRQTVERSRLEKRGKLEPIFLCRPQV
jgi:SAM-dependent methyltransferase